MTDKELRKLNRLELLEMLLDVSRENENLKKALEKAEEANVLAKNIENLSAAATQINTALERADNLTDILKKTSLNRLFPKTMDSLREKTEEVPEVPAIKKASQDGELYCTIMAYYAANQDALNSLPEEIREKIKDRIRSVLDGKSNN